jgi:predicted RNA binding protein YcfA (HicA-like mRNA interferase family)
VSLRLAGRLSGRPCSKPACMPAQRAPGKQECSPYRLRSQRWMSAKRSPRISARRCYRGIVKIRDLIRLVESDGWRHVRTTGSHRHFKHPSKPNVVTIPGHPNHELPVGTLKSILKAAGLEGRSK